MPDEVIVRQCAPTLAGIKTGSLFPTEHQGLEELYEDIKRLNRRLSSKGLRIIPMRCGSNKALLYLYRPKHLERDLSNCEANKLLQEMGYRCATPEQYIARLVSRFRSLSAFPHEVGLFLGYPPEDVRGFIENRASNYKCVGTWKVYGDAEKAQTMFRQYKLCAAAYYEQWRKGKSIERLSVAV